MRTEWDNSLCLSAVYWDGKFFIFYKTNTALRYTALEVKIVANTSSIVYMSSFLSTNVCELTTEVSDNTLSMLTSKSIQENFMFVVYFRSLNEYHHHMFYIQRHDWLEYSPDAVFELPVLNF